jgi:hypothetical protein
MIVVIIVPNCKYANCGLSISTHIKSNKFCISETHLLADTPMLASSERLIRALRALTNSAKPIVDLLAIILIILICLRCYTLGIAPTCRVPFCWFLPYPGVSLTDGGASQYVMAGGDDVCTVFRWGRECCRDGDVSANFAEYAMDRRVYA